MNSEKRLTARTAFADRLFDLCTRHADQMAEEWYKNLIANPRTSSYRSIAKENCKNHAIFIYKNLGQIYFSENCYQAVAHALDVNGFVEDHFARGIPLDEVVYALVLMRRQIFLYSEQQALSNNVEDLSELLQVINRVVLLFDYATFVVASKYREIPSSTMKLTKIQMFQGWFPDLGKK